MIREDRELLAELAQLNSDLVPLAVRMMEDNATPEEQRTFADRLSELGERLRRRADEAEMVVEGETVTDKADTADTVMLRKER